ncbi:DUF2027 domain-containing protein [Butyricimonas hominis]|uniref:DUF2027 domain-containing protein n=1 Tax=Butyricimonas hominis TaxID=2763032 RepID=A0ABR7D1I5_9BACT|nr:DUF2027 domain-containing protein [Butyricimonas hominis]MBC5621801.1 DUF2027 domain-containing protein [Butyricimonas hominis]
MNVRIGDIVRFISEKLEGKVTGIIDNNTVNVFCDEYGFEIPASTNDLVVIHTDSAPVNKINESPAVKQKNVVMQSADTVYLAFVPENFNDLTGSRFDIYLVNDTTQTSLYSISFHDGEKYTGITAGNSNPDTTYLIGNYSLKELDNIKGIHVQAVFYQKGVHQLRNAIDAQIKIVPTNLCKTGAYKHTRWFNTITLLRPLDKESIVKEEGLEVIPEQFLEKAAPKPEDKQHERPHKQMVGNILEVDLHISQLLETTVGMDNKDMLEYQMDVFHKTLEEYKLRRGMKIVFIHGKGDGVLRQRILWELQTKYKRFNHQDASFKQYGYGATMVTIK